MPASGRPRIERVLEVILLRILRERPNGLDIKSAYHLIEERHALPVDWRAPIAAKGSSYRKLQAKGIDWRRLSPDELSQHVGTEPKWQNRLRYVSRRLRDRGLLDGSAPRGLWRLTAAGLSVGQNDPHLGQDFTPAEIAVLKARDTQSARANEANDLRREFIEGQRLASERFFFSRNPELARKAKARLGYQCQACGFDFSKQYGELGSQYIDCHHLNPLSERSEEEWTSDVRTSLEDVAVLCANCHRMVHRKRPALSLDELRAYLRKRL